MRESHKSWARTLWAVFLVAGLALGGCATRPSSDDPEAAAEIDATNDPMEGLNRGIFTFNRGVDAIVLKPAATAYKDFLPVPVQTGIHNFLNNLRSPLILVHDVLQGEWDRAGDTVARFAINSTVGILGFRDQAAEWGYEFHNEDFGQTLAAWGVGEGPYVMLPVLGPSNPRDTVGLVADFLLDPINLLAQNTGHEEAVLARTGTRAIDTRARFMDDLDQLERTSLDYYATIRSAYRQRRAYEISNGADGGEPPGPSMDMDLLDNEPLAPTPVAEPEETQPSTELAALPPADEPVGEAEILLASFATHEEALRGWETLLVQYGETLAEADPVFSEAVIGSRTEIRLAAAVPLDQAMDVAALPIEATTLTAPATPVRAVAKTMPPAPRKPTRTASAPRASPPVAEPPAPAETLVHLASYRNHAEAYRGWEVFSERHGATLLNADPVFTEVRVGTETYVRLLVSLPGVKQAGTICDAFSADSNYCRILVN